MLGGLGDGIAPPMLPLTIVLVAHGALPLTSAILVCVLLQSSFLIFGFRRFSLRDVIYRHSDTFFLGALIYLLIYLGIGLGHNDDHRPWTELPNATSKQ